MTGEQTMASISAFQVTSSIRNQIHLALFGETRPVGDTMCDKERSLDEVHQLSQEFSLASSMGGGGMLGIQALGHQTRSYHRDCRQ
jgi:hypothetical protein